MAQLAVITTYPHEWWENGMAKKALDSWQKHMPSGTDFYVYNVEECPDWCIKINAAQPERDFWERHKDRPVSSDYRTHLVRFSHKVFAQKRIMKYFEMHASYPQELLWLDCDVIMHADMTHEDFNGILGNADVAYLGRHDWDTSETGFILYNPRNPKTIDKMYDYYITDKVLDLDQYTDAHVFDRSRDVNSRNITDGVNGRDVWDHSILAKWMTHHKGQRKADIQPQAEAPAPEVIPTTKHQGSLGIITKNCVPEEQILENIRQNLQIVLRDNWLGANMESNETIVLCSAGPSLNINDIMPLYKAGHKIVAVKHALAPLMEAGITPWACILLDPRQHVGDFVQYPIKEVNYFVASMVDPQVVMHLRQSGAKLFGYHALVNREMLGIIPQGHYVVNGGSATATRSIFLLNAMGFRKFKLFGYDLCYDKKPDLSELRNNGKMKYEEVTLQAESWGGKKSVRTVWTESQLLAQLQEFVDLILPKAAKGEIEIEAYGYGLVPWYMHHAESLENWKNYERDRNRTDGFRNGDINRWISERITGAAIRPGEPCTQPG